MPALIRPREEFSQPEPVSHVWTLSKGTKRARCEVWTHLHGFELRLLVGAQQTLSTIRRLEEDLIRVDQEWRSMLEAEGWSM